MKASALYLVIAAALSVWTSSTAAQQQNIVTIHPAPYQPCRDFGVDGRPDVVWQHPSGALLVTHHGDWHNLISTEPIPYASPIRRTVMAVNCMDTADQEPDLVMQDSAGGITILRMHDTTPIEEILVQPFSASLVVTTADFDQDGSIDLVLQDPIKGLAYIQFMKGTVAENRTAELPTGGDVLWRIVAAPDLNSDGHPDIVWQHYGTGQIEIWVMSGPTTVQRYLTISAVTRLRVVGYGEYAGWYGTDLLLQDPASGELWAYEFEGLTYQNALRLSNSTRWRAMSQSLPMRILVSGDPLPTAPAAPPPPPPIDWSSSAQVGNRLVKLRAAHSNKCLGMLQGLSVNGVRLQQETCNSSAVDQLFWLTRLGTIVSALGRVVEVGGGGTLNGAGVNLWTDAGGANQRWRFVDLGRELFAVVNSQSGKVLDVAGESMVDGAPIQQWAYTGRDNQKWALVNAGSTVALGATTGLFRLATHSGKCLDLPGTTMVMGTQLQQWDCNGNSAQTFWFVNDAGYRRIVTVTGQVLDVSGASGADGAPITQWEWNAGDNQRWLVLTLPNSEWGLVSKSTGKVVDISGGSLANGAPIIQWTFVNGANQKWRFERVLP